MQIINSYIQNIDRLFQTGNAREHSYRGDLQKKGDEVQLIKEIHHFQAL